MPVLRIVRNFSVEFPVLRAIMKMQRYALHSVCFTKDGRSFQWRIKEADVYKRQGFEKAVRGEYGGEGWEGKV